MRNWYSATLASLIVIALVWTVVACASWGINGKDATTAVRARESVCALARISQAQAPTDATLVAVVRACDAGDDLKKVARVYGGCER